MEHQEIPISTKERMGNKHKIELPEKFVEYLSQQPETGMGYQLVDIILKNGKHLEKRMVFNSMYLQVDQDENISLNEIENIKLHII